MVFLPRALLATSTELFCDERVLLDVIFDLLCLIKFIFIFLDLLLLRLRLWFCAFPSPFLDLDAVDLCSSLSLVCFDHHAHSLREKTGSSVA